MRQQEILCDARRHEKPKATNVGKFCYVKVIGQSEFFDTESSGYIPVGVHQFENAACRDTRALRVAHSWRTWPTSHVT